MLHKTLILGGTKDARMLAAALVSAGHHVVTSLAGVTAHPNRPAGQIRTGGFGGALGLRDYLLREGIGILIDATHPFASQISANAAAAVSDLAIRHLRLERPPWLTTAEDRWISCATISEAARAAPEGARILLTIGRKGIAPFVARSTLSGVIRCIEPPAEPIPPNWTLMLARPPFSLDDEIKLLRDHGITHLVTKNAGGPETEDKLEAARILRLPVLMIERPVKQGGESFANITAIVENLSRASGKGGA